jgi:hypothetical protein
MLAGIKGSVVETMKKMVNDTITVQMMERLMVSGIEAQQKEINVAN